MTYEPCSKCALSISYLRREIRVNERRERAGKPVDLSRATRLKADIAECKANGHWRHPERSSA